MRPYGLLSRLRRHVYLIGAGAGALVRGGQEQGGPVRTDDPSSPLGRAQEDNCPPSRLPAPYDRMPETASNPPSFPSSKAFCAAMNRLEIQPPYRRTGNAVNGSGTSEASVSFHETNTVIGTSSIVIRRSCPINQDRIRPLHDERAAEQVVAPTL